MIFAPDRIYNTGNVLALKPYPKLAHTIKIYEEYFDVWRKIYQEEIAENTWKGLSLEARESLRKIIKVPGIYRDAPMHDAETFFNVFKACDLQVVDCTNGKLAPPRDFIPPVRTEGFPGDRMLAFYRADIDKPADVPVYICMVPI